LPTRVTRAAPYIYSEVEVAALLEATGQLRPQIRAVTFHTLIALMAATGIRTGEALGLDVTDFDQRASTLTVTGKYGKTRRLPLHPSVRDALTDYLLQRQRLLPAASAPALLVTSRGSRLTPQSVHPVFRTLTNQAGIIDASSACRPRLHDLRHRFAVLTMLHAYRSGQDPAAVLPVLATWLGHADPGDTYWYLTGTAELLEAAMQRLDALAGRPEGGPS
jgi:integrase/recombinase XerD